MADLTAFLTQLDLVKGIVAALVCIFFLRQICDLVGWFVKATGLETNVSRKQKAAVTELAEHDKAIDTLSDRIDGISSQLKALSDKITTNERVTDHRRTRELRKDILDFANCMVQRHYSKEMCEEILDSYDEYEELLDKWGETNGRTARAMEDIRSYCKSLG